MTDTKRALNEEAVHQVAKTVYEEDPDALEDLGGIEGYQTDARAYLTAYHAWLESKGAVVLFPGDVPPWFEEYEIDHPDFLRSASYIPDDVKEEIRKMFIRYRNTAQPTKEKQ
jgi:hypothetical protein